MQDWPTTLAEAVSVVGLVMTLYLLVRTPKRLKTTALFFVLSTVLLFWAFRRVHQQPKNFSASAGLSPGSNGSQPQPSETSHGGTGKSEPAANPSPSSRIIESKSRSVQEGVRDYNRSFVDLSLSGHASLERLYHQAVRLATLMTVPPDSGGQSFLERLQPSEVEGLAQQLPGIVFYRHEIMNVTIDSVFFLSLAKKSGTPADVEFFQDWRLTFPETTWAPRYVKQQTDYSGCTDYGNGELSRVFAMWSAYAFRYPGDYADDVAERLDAIRYYLTKDTCACGNKESVENELQRFLSTFPNDQSASLVANRLRALRAGTLQMRFNCLSG